MLPGLSALSSLACEDGSAWSPGERIALTSGLTRKQIASDLGVGLSTLNKWITAHRDTDVASVEDLELARENKRLGCENRILKEERDILKKATVFFASQKP